MKKVSTLKRKNKKKAIKILRRGYINKIKIKKKRYWGAHMKGKIIKKKNNQNYKKKRKKENL